MFIPKNPPHPGEMLSEEYLKPMGLTQRQLADHIGMTPAQVSMLVNGTLGVTPRTARLLSQAFGTSVEMWMNMQMVYDLAKEPAPKKVGRLVAKVGRPVENYVQIATKKVRTGRDTHA